MVAIARVISAFNDMKLHRIDANIIPYNKASLRVVEKPSFYEEGGFTKLSNGVRSPLILLTYVCQRQRLKNQMC